MVEEPGEGQMSIDECFRCGRTVQYFNFALHTMALRDAYTSDRGSRFFFYLLVPTILGQTALKQIATR